MPLYVAETIGSNDCLARATDAQGRRYSSACDHPSSTVYLGGHDPETGAWQDMTVALFESCEDARAVALACHHNGQGFKVRAARGKVRETGTVIPAGTVGEVV
jgi:hypothetical protein